MVSEDGLVVSAQIRGDRKERYLRHRDERPEGASKSEFLRNLIDVGLDTREQSVYTRLGCKPKLRTAIEELREPEQEREDVIIELLREAVEARDADAVETLADDNLRDRVEALADEGEPVDDAARRLLRNAVEEEEGEGSWIRQRAQFTALMLVLTGVPALAGYYGTADGALFTVGFFVVLFVFGEDINRFTEWVLKRFADGVRKVKP
jgi:hypothetical protein